jgi:coenzyme Q-binding protein COQ10
MQATEPVRYAQSAYVPFAPEQMFDLVADIERYPEFLGEYRSARIVGRTGDTCRVEQVIGFGLLELTLDAVATLQRPTAIVVRSQHALLGELVIAWGFARSDAATRVDFRLTLVPTSALAAGVAGHLLGRYAPRTLQAFTGRAMRLYGGDALTA